MQRYLVLDFETRSKVLIGEVGSYEYARHSSTKLLCVSWRLGTLSELRSQLESGVPAKKWTPAFGWTGPNDSWGELRDALLDPSVLLVAHNALFEQCVTRYVLTKLIFNPGLKEIPISRWLCTASLARRMSLPGKLEDACTVLKLPFQKDMEGRRLMLKLSKPRRPTKHDCRLWHTKKADLIRVMDYCATDVDAQTCLLLRLPALPPEERKLWELDQEINLRGFRADRDLIQKILVMLAEENTRLDAETKTLTQGELDSTRQVSATLLWLSQRGLSLLDLRAETVREALTREDLTPEIRRLLEIRRDAGKASVKKYKALELRSRTDGYVRDILVYHSASTGRWGGAGVQPQNFPRGTVKLAPEDFEFLRTGDLDDVRIFLGNPIDVFSSALRGMIVA